MQINTLFDTTELEKYEEMFEILYFENTDEDFIRIKIVKDEFEDIEFHYLKVSFFDPEKEETFKLKFEYEIDTLEKRNEILENDEIRYRFEKLLGDILVAILVKFDGQIRTIKKEDE